MSPQRAVRSPTVTGAEGLAPAESAQPCGPGVSVGELSAGQLHRDVCRSS